MKSLKIIQTLAKIGKIISKVLFVLCLVGCGGCLLGILGLSVGLGTMKLGGFTIHGVIEEYASMGVPSIYGAMAVGLVFCAAEAVLCKFSELYFTHELADGTPFTLSGSKELLRLGILAALIPMAAATVCAIGIAIASRFYPEVDNLSIDIFGSFGIGIMMIITSLICRYGADLREGRIVEETESAE